MGHTVFPATFQEPGCELSEQGGEAACLRSTIPNHVKHAPSYSMHVREDACWLSGTAVATHSGAVPLHALMMCLAINLISPTCRFIQHAVAPGSSRPSSTSD